MSLWNPTAENVPRRELRTLQFDKLKVLVNRVYNESPYYKNKLTAAGVSPEHLKSLEHYQDFPFLIIGGCPPILDNVIGGYRDRLTSEVLIRR